MSRVLSLLLIFVLTSSVQAQAKIEPLVGKVKNSISRGVAHVISQRRPNGSWEQPESGEKKEEAIANAYPGGSTALVVLALLNCDGVLDDPNLEKKRKDCVEIGLDHLRTIDSKKVYVRALQTMVFAEAGKAKDLQIIKKNVKWLLEARVYRDGKFVGWDYHNRPNAMATDASNSQYAMLALWYARQAGVSIDRKVWEEIRESYTRSQNADGSWAYSMNWGDDMKRPSVTMTVAGLCGLLIAGMELNGGRESWLPNGRANNCGVYGEDVPVAKAMRWINDTFNVKLQERSYYHLYGLERAGRLSGLRFFGEHDWYREGCEFLTKQQDPNGSWKNQGGWDRWPLVNTSFALLFLSKGRTPVLVSKLVHGKWGAAGRDEADHDWNNDRNDLRHLAEYVSKTNVFDKKAIAWQTYDISQAIQARLDKNPAPTEEDEAAILADMLQSPILYITGHFSPLRRFQNIENRLIKRYVENGGFIFAEACCGSPAFDQGIKAWVQENWDGQELTYLDASHSVWMSENTIRAGDPYKLMGLQVGCRTVMLYSPLDLSCHWESNRVNEGPTRRAFELGANIIAYATGRVPPQPRLTPIHIVSEKAKLATPKRGYFQIAQLYHAGDWQPAPKAMTNLLEHVNKAAGLDVVLKVERVLLSGDDDSVKHAKFLYMHGRNPFDLKVGLEPLRFSLENGGLLFADACCGKSAFDKSFRSFVQELFPKEKLQRVPIDPKRDALFGEDLNGAGEALSIGNIKCRITANGQMLPMEPYLEGIQINGRWVILYSKYDIGCALERHTSLDCVGYDPDSALRIATAAVRYNTPAVNVYAKPPGIAALILGLETLHYEYRMTVHNALTDEERAIYEWQLWVEGFGEAGQLRLKNSTVLISRCGGVGGTVALHLATAGVGRLILAHAGNLRPSDLNRQLLMSHAGLDQERVEQAAERLRALNPYVEIIPVPENITGENVDRLVEQADVVASCAPLFEERLLLNRAAVEQNKPLVDAAMYELEAQLTTVIPGRSPCLACLYPAKPLAWKRQFPVFGAVAGAIASLGALEVIKLLAGLGEPLAGTMLVCDLGKMSFRKIRLHRNNSCPVCAPQSKLPMTND